MKIHNDYNGKHLAETIKNLVKRKGISVKRLLSDLELGKNYMAQISNNVIPGVDKIVKIAQYLNCSIDYLLGVDNMENVDTFNNVVVNRINVLLEHTGYSKADLCRVTGIPTSTLGNWLNSGREIPASKIAEISNFFGVSIGYILGLTDEPYSTVISSEQLTDFFQFIPPIMQKEVKKYLYQKVRNTARDIRGLADKIRSSDLDVVQFKNVLEEWFLGKPEDNTNTIIYKHIEDRLYFILNYVGITPEQFIKKLFVLSNGLSAQEQTLITDFRRLDDADKVRIQERISILLENEKYLQAPAQAAQ